VFSLGEEVCRNKGGIGVAACNDHQFARPGWHVDGAALELHNLLGAGDKPVTGPEDLVNSRD